MMKSDSNKTVSEIMQSYCVMVNGGSGVLVNAMTQEFSYVLTARHAVFEDAARNVVVDHNQNSIEVLGVLVFPKVGQQESLDCAVLKITHQADLSQKSWSAAHLPLRPTSLLWASQKRKGRVQRQSSIGLATRPAWSTTL